MFSVSTPAAAKMTDLLTPKNDDAVLRIVRRDGRFRLRVSQVREGDRTFTHDGRIVLALDATTNESLARRSLAIRRTTTGERLKLTAR